MKLQKEAWHNIVKTVAFLLILALLFLFFTYLFRDTSVFKREIILNYYTEPEDTLDVVVIGSSNVIRYWDPLLAWKEYGITSYNFATTAMKDGTYLAALKEALQTQSPELVIVETRLFGRNDSVKPETIGARHLLDCLDYDLDRLQGVKYYCDTLNIPWYEAIDLYIDLMYYHTNYDALLTRKNWSMADNRIERNDGLSKGYAPLGKVCAFEDPSANLTEEAAQLDPAAEKFLVDILEYCQQENIQLLLVASPIVTNSSEARRSNGVGLIAEQYGVPFLDTNRHYDELGIDFSTDFGDSHHMNIWGATKFTNFIANYLKEHYDLPDRRNDPDYAALWETAYETYQPIAEKAGNKVAQSVEAKERAIAGFDRMKQTEDLLEWLALADNEEMTLFVLSGTPAGNEPSAENKLLLRSIGVADKYWDSSFAVVYQNEVIWQGEKKTFTGVLGGAEIPYKISVKSVPVLEVGDVSYADESFAGVQIAAYSNSLNKMIDRIGLTIQPDGTIVLTHRLP